jgi:predicted O-methyltransferase YrrM
LREAGVLDRVTLAPGDFYSDALPGGHDLVFVSAIIHQNDPVQNVDLFRKAFAALEPGGRIVVRDHVLSPDRTTPRSGALFAVNMLTVFGGGNSYTLAEISDALTQAGFGQVRQIHTDTHMDGLVEAYKPRSMRASNLTGH